MRQPISYDEYYRPSGSFGVLLPVLMALGAAVALGMAYVLYLAEAKFYFYFIVPALLGAPVMGAIALAVWGGKCRSPWLAGVAGLGLMLVFYIGYWQISYQQNVGKYGELGEMIIEAETGARGLPGYFLYRCQNSQPTTSHSFDDDDNERRPPSKGGGIINYFLFGGELLVLSFIGFGVGRFMASRVFYENEQRWASSFSFLLAPKDHEAAAAAIRSADWHALAKLPKIAHDATQAKTNVIRIKIEYLKGSAIAPIYLSIWPTGERSESHLLVFLDKPGAVRQKAIMGESAERMRSAFALEMAGGKAMDGAAPSEGDAIRDRLVGSGEVTGAQCEAVEPDSIQRVARFGKGYTFALIVCLVLGLGGAVAMLVSMAGQKGQPLSAIQIALTACFVSGLAGGMLVILLYYPVLYLVLKRQLARREGSLLPEMQRPTFFRIYFAERFHLKEKAIDDIAFVGAGGSQGEFLIEGIRYRYRIVSTALSRIDPVQSDSTIAIQVDITCGDQPLRLMLARDNLKGNLEQQLPVSAAKDASNIVKRWQESLNVPAKGDPNPLTDPADQAR